MQSQRRANSVQRSPGNNIFTAKNVLKAFGQAVGHNGVQAQNQNIFAEPRKFVLEGKIAIPRDGIAQYNPMNSFTDIFYLSKYQLTEAKNNRFIPLGPNCQVETEDFLYIGQKGIKHYFCKAKDINHVEARDLVFNNDFKKINAGGIVEDVKKIGWIVLKKDQWGFQFNSAIAEEIEQGRLPLYLHKVLKYQFFKKLLKIENEGQDLANIPDPITPVFNRLFPHQKKEVKWMLRCEKFRDWEIWDDKLPSEQPLCGTEYCVDPHNPIKLMQKYANQRKISLPGMLFRGQVGYGRTVSVVAMMAIGYDKIEESKRIADDDPKNQSRNPSLLIAPVQRLASWERKFKEFSPKLKVFVLKDLNMEGEGDLRIEDYHVILTHPKVIEDGEKLVTLYPQFFVKEFQRIIIDKFEDALSGYVKTIYPQQQESVDSEKQDMDWEMFMIFLTSLKRKFTWGIASSIQIYTVMKNITSINALLGLGIEDPVAIRKDLTYILHSWGNFTRTDSLFKPLTQALNTVEITHSKNPLYGLKLRTIRDTQDAKDLLEMTLHDYQEIPLENRTVELALQSMKNKHMEEMYQLKKLIQSAKTESEVQGFQNQLKRFEAGNNYYSEKIKTFEQGQIECPICMSDVNLKKIVIFSCLHQVCITCYTIMLDKLAADKCSFCKKKLAPNEFVLHPLYNFKNKVNKFTTMISEIFDVPKEEKVVIFFQFEFMLEKIEENFTKLGIKYRSVKKRNSNEVPAITPQEEADIKAILVSIDQLELEDENFIEANHVIFAHPLFGMDKEKAKSVYVRCITKVHRVGQKKQVNAQLLALKGSVEEDLAWNFLKCFTKEETIKESLRIVPSKQT